MEFMCMLLMTGKGLQKGFIEILKNTWMGFLVNLWSASHQKTEFTQSIIPLFDHYLLSNSSYKHVTVKAFLDDIISPN